MIISDQNVMINGILVHVKNDRVSFLQRAKILIEGEISEGEKKSVHIIRPFQGLPRKFEDAPDLVFLNYAVRFLVSEWHKFNIIDESQRFVIKNFSRIEELAIPLVLKYSAQEWLSDSEFDSISEALLPKVENARSTGNIEEYHTHHDRWLAVMDEWLAYLDIMEDFIKRLPGGTKKYLGEIVDVNGYLYVRGKMRKGENPVLYEYRQMCDEAYRDKCGNGIYQPLEEEFINLLRNPSNRDNHE
jgi:hypothetical protein